jgi:CDP-glucose 4,6-dehydratase
MTLSAYRDKNVLVTGHTGFKGAWLCRMLELLGAEVTGYALMPPTEPSLFTLSGVGSGMRSIQGDVRDYPSLFNVFRESEPEIVFHLAAQPIVRKSYEDPRGTYETNVMGTVNVLECIRQTASVKSFVNVTTDKVYENKEWEWGYRESEPLDGYDPYSNSKSCSELVTHSYGKSFFGDGRVAVSTARAGNVIGGGDFAPDRIIPDCVRAAVAGKGIIVRNPDSIRPYQHVFDPLYAYLLIAIRQREDGNLAGWYNVGPDEDSCVSTGRLVDLFVKDWGDGLDWETRRDGGPHEANYLRLDSSRLKRRFGWSPRWGIGTAVEKTVEWTKCWHSGGDVLSCMDRQIGEFLDGNGRSGDV